jgi:hypothetical protein
MVACQLPTLKVVGSTPVLVVFYPAYQEPAFRYLKRKSDDGWSCTARAVKAAGTADHHARSPCLDHIIIDRDHGLY